MKRFTRLVFASFISFTLAFSISTVSADEVEDLIEQANLAINEQNLDQAIDVLNQATGLAENPIDKANIHSLYAYIYYLQGEFGTALGNYQAAYEIVAAFEDTLEYQRDLLASLEFIHRELGNAEQRAKYEALLATVEAELEASKTQVWITNEETGDLAYQPLELVFPPVVGRFVRKEHHMFTNDGSDVSVGYQITDLSDKAYMTIYLSNYLDSDFDDYIAFSRRDLLARYQGTADILDEKRIIFPAQGEDEESGAYGFRLKIKNPENHENWSDEELWIAGYGHWFIKIRVTKKEVFEEEVGPSFLKILNEVDLALNDNFISVLVAQREGIDFCTPNKFGQGQGKRPEHYEPGKIVAVLGLPLIKQAEGQASQVAAGKCLNWVTGVESGHKVASYVYTTPEIAEQISTGVFQIKIFEPNWDIHSTYEISREPGLNQLLGLPDVEGVQEEFYFLTRRDSGRVQLFEFYEGEPSLDRFYEDAVSAASEEKPILLEAVANEEGGYEMVVHGAIMGEEEGWPISEPQ